MAQRKAHEVDGFILKPSSTFPIVLVYGPDKGLVSERATLFAKNTGIDLQDPFSTLKIDASEIDSDPARLGDEARTVTLFGGQRLIWVRNASAQKGLADAVKWLIATPPQGAYVLIEAGDLKKGVTGLRGIVEAGSCSMALPCYSDNQSGIDALIDQVLDEFSMKISMDARKWLRESLGADRLASRGELEKLCFYAKGQDEISVDDVAHAVSDVSALSQDEIIDTVLSGNIDSFNQHFDRQVESGAALFLVLSAAQRQFQQLMQMRAHMDNDRASASQLVKSARPPIFFKRAQIVERALNSWTMPRIIRAMERLQNAVLESRKSAALSVPIIRQTLLALTVEAARSSQR
ncbi:DNA polymerase III subunit delta [Bartonella sp. HY038]|uniref:DNA polymerase III subunit delta n=1 Tax=Bartonella sp. HY038 TaxID=2759660 RepID=UPI0015F989F6|nr:DNA polymerase III subunit delta [Bartonella sp. HY038]